MIDFLHILIPKAAAVAIEKAGADAPGVSGMWQDICETLPFCDLGSRAPEVFAGRIVEIVSSLIAGGAIIAIIYGAIKLTTSNGEDGVSEAKKIITYALIGLGLSVVAPAIINRAYQLLQQVVGG